jgi:hypothetical protein
MVTAFVLTMLQRKQGATIATIMKATGCQPRSGIPNRDYHRWSTSAQHRRKS